MATDSFKQRVTRVVKNIKIKTKQCFYMCVKINSNLKTKDANPHNHVHKSNALPPGYTGKQYNINDKYVPLKSQAMPCV